MPCKVSIFDLSIKFNEKKFITEMFDDFYMNIIPYLDINIPS